MKINEDLIKTSLLTGRRITVRAYSDNSLFYTEAIINGNVVAELEPIKSQWAEGFGLNDMMENMLTKIGEIIKELIAKKTFFYPIIDAYCGADSGIHYGEPAMNLLMYGNLEGVKCY